MTKNANELKSERKLENKIKPPNKQAKHAKIIPQQTSKKIPLLIGPMCPNIGQVGNTKHLLGKSNWKMQKGVVYVQKTRKKNATS